MGEDGLRQIDRAGAVYRPGERRVGGSGADGGDAGEMDAEIGLQRFKPREHACAVGDVERVGRVWAVAGDPRGREGG